VVHRDLKPANVMLVPTPQDPLFVKVLDFGVAKSIQPGHETQLTRTGMIVGTVEYMAPEQIIGRAVDARTDVYALGVLLYRMLAGSPVFIEQGVPAIIHNHLNTEPQSILKRAPDANVPAMLDKVVQRCLAKRPEGRFASMAEVSRAIREALDVELDALPDLGFSDERDSWAKTEVAASPFADVYDPGNAPHDDDLLSVDVDLSSDDQDDALSSQETRVAKRTAVTLDTPIPPALQRQQQYPKKR
jgi:serine/threonine-protein kinase